MATDPGSARLFDTTPYDTGRTRHPTLIPDVELIPGTRKSRTSCIRCAHRFEWYESTLLGAKLPQFVRRVCPPCRQRLMAQVRAHRMDDATALAFATTTACQLCGVRNDRSRGLVVDHDHRCCPRRNSCGRCIRGFLCDACNKAIGGIDYWFNGPGIDAALWYLKQRD